jgi:ferritin
MISKKIEKIINEQINAELYSAYLYLSMRAYFDANDLPGFANWMYVQALEEFTHADKFYRFIVERGGKPVMKAIDNPQGQWKDVLDVMQGVYEHEQKVTSLINNIVNLAIEEKDHATNSFLQWFINEQVEEEASAMEVIRKLKMVKAAPGAMFMLDNEMGTRTFIPPTAAAGE